MEIPFQLLELDELRQRSLARGLQLAGVLAQLGRDELVAEELVQLLLVPVGDRFVGLGVQDAVLGDREPAPLRLFAHGDVVVLRAREVLEEVAVALGRNDAEVEAEPVPRDHGRLRPTARRHLDHPRQLGEVRDERFGIAGGRDDVDVADGLTPPPCAARFRHLDRGRVRTKLLDRLQQRGQRHAEQRSCGAGLALRLGERTKDVLLASRPEPGQRPQLLRFSRLP